MYFYMHWTACFQKCNLISAYVMRYEIDMIITCIVGLGDVCVFFGRISWVHHFHFLHPHNLPFARPLDTIWEPELYHTEIRKKTHISIFTVGSFNNYVDQILPNFDIPPPPLPSSVQKWTIYIPPYARHCNPQSVLFSSTFWSPKTGFFSLKILASCMASIQEQFLIKTGL